MLLNVLILMSFPAACLSVKKFFVILYYNLQERWNVIPLRSIILKELAATFHTRIKTSGICTYSGFCTWFLQPNDTNNISECLK